MEKEQEMIQTIERLCQKYKGILAADESTGTIAKRFAAINLENTQDNRRNYRNMLFTTPNLEQHISGVIVYEETLFDNYNGTKLVQPLLDKNIVVGIKTDSGLVNLPFNDEKMTYGLDTLVRRSNEYYNAGARFAKWRCVFECEKGKPSNSAIKININTLVTYASISQKCGLVPIVEPEVLVENYNSIEECEYVTKMVLTELFYELNKQNVRLDLMLLKPNMIRNGEKCNNTVDLNDIAMRTTRVLRETVPSSVLGIFFLSGGLSEVDATECLYKIHNILDKQYSTSIGKFYYYHCGQANKPWRVSFSYGRALQQSVIELWNGNNDNNVISQQKLFELSKSNGYASMSLMLVEYESESDSEIDN